MANKTFDKIEYSSSTFLPQIPFVKGPSTDTTAGTWTGTLSGVDTLEDGLTILYKPAVKGASTTTLKLNSLDAKTVYINNTSKLTTHFPANQPILLVYSSSQNSGCWMCVDNYTDGNTKNTAGSTDTSSKIYLIGATSQAANPQTYSHDTAYVDTDGCLYSNSTKVSVEGHTHSAATTSADGLMSSSDKTKLNGIATGAEVNVQSDWNQTTNTADDYIKNKPTIPTVTDTYSGTSSNAMSGKAVKSAIDALDGTVSGSAGSGKTLTAFSQTDGKVSATFGNISITKSQISDFPTIPTLKNVFGKVKVGDTTIEADTTQDTLELVAGTKISLTPDTTNDKVTINGIPEIFIAGFGSTEFSEITDAVSAGKTVYCFIDQDDGYVICPLAETTSTSYIFCGPLNNQILMVTVSESGGTTTWAGDVHEIPTVTDTYDGTSSDGMSGVAVKSAIDALDGSVTGSAGSGKTLTAFSQTNGKVSATFGDISITKSQVSDFPTIPTVTDTYSSTSSNAMSGKAVSSAISGKIDTAGTGLSKSDTTLNHSNSVTAQTTQALYPIKIDAQGHISAYGSAVTPLTVKTQSGKSITTNAQGAAALSSWVSSTDTVVAIYCTSNTNALCIPFLYNGSSWYVKCVNWQNFNIIANTSLTITIRYL